MTWKYTGPPYLWGTHPKIPRGKPETADKLYMSCFFLYVKDVLYGLFSAHSNCQHHHSRAVGPS